jgi:hypothetical protein
MGRLAAKKLLGASEAMAELVAPARLVKRESSSSPPRG